MPIDNIDMAERTLGLMFLIMVFLILGFYLIMYSPPIIPWFTIISSSIVLILLAVVFYKKKDD